MRVAILGVAHWHLPLYLDPLLEIDDVDVVAVSDPHAATAASVAERIGCTGTTSWQEAVDEHSVEFAVVLGAHDEMPDVCAGLIARGIRFVVEKPAGIRSEQVAELADAAASRGVDVAVPFVFRHGALLETYRSHARDGEALYFAAKLSAGSVDRYRGGSEWMLQRARSGGGAMLNLGIHFMDLASVLLGPGLRVEGAMMSNALEGLEIEDHGVALLRGSRGSALVETSYTYTAPHLSFDLHFSIRTPSLHVAARDDTGVEVLAPTGLVERAEAPVSNPVAYRPFMRDVVARVRDGRPMVAGLRELETAFRLVEEAYALSPLPPARPSRSRSRPD